MYSLKEYWQLRDLPLPKGEWDGNVICLETNVEWTFGANETHGFLSCYTFTIVTSGWVTIIYHNSEITLNEGDLYTYSPGMEVTVLSASEDYRGICLLADERFTLSLSMVRNAVRTAYFTVVELTSSVLSLKPDDLCRLRELMLMAIRYQQSGITHSNESLQMLYSLFLLDLSAIQEHSIREHRLPKRIEEIFHRLPQSAAPALHRAPRHRFLCLPALHHHHLLLAHRPSSVRRTHRHRLHQPVPAHGGHLPLAPDIHEHQSDSRAAPLCRDHHLCPILPAHEGHESEGVQITLASPSKNAMNDNLLIS